MSIKTKRNKIIELWQGDLLEAFSDPGDDEEKETDEKSALEMATRFFDESIISLSVEEFAALKGAIK